MDSDCHTRELQEELEEEREAGASQCEALSRRGCLALTLTLTLLGCKALEEEAIEARRELEAIAGELRDLQDPLCL